MFWLLFNFQVPPVVDKYLGTKLDDALLKTLERHTADLVEKYSVLPAPESSKKQESEKSPEEIIRIKREQEEKKQEPRIDRDENATWTRKVAGKTGLIGLKEGMNDDGVMDDDDDEALSWIKPGRIGKEEIRNEAPLKAPHSCGERLLSLWIESEQVYEHKLQLHCVISIKTYERYIYNYLREIVLRRADYNEYKISEKDFKNLHPNDFEDLNILHIQGKLDHLPKHYRLICTTAVSLWTRNIVIRKHVEDLQLGIESYQTKLNLEQPNWDASDFPFKEDYTIVFKPRAVIYRDRDDNRKMMRIDEVHKFSDGTLTRIKEKLDFMVKDFKLFKFNKGMENRKWTEDDKRRSEDFIEVIERRLKIRRIFQSYGGKLCRLVTKEILTTD
ncbi:hypothetical protein Tco_0653884 [Tanacetum coccineum]|uniref:Uncharacterized protein n=1 Tax=Tanacetum coccineum TaxID=301880 RepID=A0ABQ4X1U7_9ASTR